MFQDIGASSSNLDSSRDVAISKSLGNGIFNKKFKPKVSQEDKQTKNEFGLYEQKGAHPQPQKQPSKDNTKAESKDSSSKKGAIPKDTCRKCFKKGHWAKDCYSNSNKKQKSQVSSVGVTDGSGDKPSVEQFSLQVSAVQDSSCVGLFATRGVGPLTTNDPLLTRICVENVAEMTFELDTAASHSLLAKSTFDRLQKCLAAKGRKPLVVQQQQVSIKLADGTRTDKHIGTVQMNIARTINCSNPVLVTFFILDGPNCLLSRYAVEGLWPDIYI